MAFSSSYCGCLCLMMFVSVLGISLLMNVTAGNFIQDFDISGHFKILNNGETLALSLDKDFGSGIQSKNNYLFGKFDIQIKLVPGNSAGTVTAYYVQSPTYSTRDEIDFEFLGNLNGDPYVLSTNLYTNGNGNREQQFYLWFDPRKDFHTYTILWNPLNIMDLVRHHALHNQVVSLYAAYGALTNSRGVSYYVDGTPIRQFTNMESKGVLFPNKQPMPLHSTIWDASDWATRGGHVKIDWTQAPFTSSFSKSKINGCVWTSGKSSCAAKNTWMGQKLDSVGLARLKEVQKNYMIYNYCTDLKRYPHGLPHECTI